MLSVALHDEDRVIVTVVPRTTQITQSRHEIGVGDAMFQKPGVFSAQMMLSIACGKFEYKIGELTTEEMAAVETVVRNWLGLTPPVA